MVPEVSFANALIVAVVACAVPLSLGFAPRVRLPAVMVEIVAGIVVGPAVLGWARVDLVVQVMAVIGLAFIMFLSGLEINFQRLRGPILTLTGLGFVLSIAIAVLAGLGLQRGGLAESGLFLGIALAATSLGVIVPTLKDAGQISTPFGQLVIIAASIADFGTVILLTLFFSREAASPVAQVVLIGGLIVLAVAIVAVGRYGRSMRLAGVLVRLQDTTAQIRVRGAFLLLAVFVALAERLGIEVILGAFVAGAVLKLIDRDEMLTHPDFHRKLEAIGFGVFIPFFFVASGLRFDLGALFASGAAIARVPIFLVALLLARGLPALLYRRLLGGREVVAAGLLQATSLGFVVVAAQIGMELGAISAATGAALVAAALLSVLIFPAAALSVLGRRAPRGGEAGPAVVGEGALAAPGVRR